MKCPLEAKRNEVLLAYGSRKLDGGDLRLLEDHLESCPACRDFVQAQRAVWDALDVWEPAPVSADFDRRLYQRIERQPMSWLDRMMRPFQSFGLRYAVPVAASAAVVLMAGLLIHRTPSPLPAPQRDTAQMETLQPEQVELALDEMEALSQLSSPVRADKADSKM
jgi:anti-sigma factor RsiW